MSCKNGNQRVGIRARCKNGNRRVGIRARCRLRRLLACAPRFVYLATPSSTLLAGPLVRPRDRIRARRRLLRTVSKRAQRKRPPFGDRQVASTLSTRCPYAIVRRRGTCPSGRSRWGTSRSRRPSRCSRRPGRGSRCRRRGRRCCCRPPCRARRERPRRAWRA